MLEYCDRSSRLAIAATAPVSIVAYYGNANIAAMLARDLQGVVTGTHHTLFLAEAGELYACGSNSDGQLGLGDTEDRSSLTLVPTPTPVQSVVAGTDHSLCLATTGQLYACGYNGHGQLGLGDTEDRSTLTLVPTPTPVLSVTAGDRR
jgi:alpha-tubulin suppressor-like RCC1 family protein